MTLDYLQCEKHFDSSIENEPIALEMYEDHEKDGYLAVVSHQTCDCVIKGKTCGKKAYAVFKYKNDYDNDKLNLIDVSPIWRGN